MKTTTSKAFPYSFVPNCRVGGEWGRVGGGSNKMHQRSNYQDFLKWGEGGVRSFSYNNQMNLSGFFIQNLQFDASPPAQLGTRE